MTRYRRIDPEIVEAWQYTGGGVFPEGCRDALERRQAFWCNHEITRLPDAVYAATGMTPPAPGERHDYLYWSEDGNNRCHAGDWIVRDEDGRLDIWSDAEFRVAFAPVESEHMNDDEARLTPMERRALDRMDAHTQELRGMSDTTNEHVTAIRKLVDVYGSRHLIIDHADALAVELAEAQRERDAATARAGDPA